MRRFFTAAIAAVAVLAVAQPASAAPAPGSPGIGDSYFPDYGNGGYDVGHYDIRLRYTPATDRLQGTTTILATATQELSSFNLDFLLHVDSVQVNNRAATFATTGDHELVVTPARPVAAGQRLTVVVQYSDIPSAHTSANGLENWKRLPDGAIAVGQPEMAWWWFPSNDHPGDKATFDVSVIVPNDIVALSNGVQVAKTPVLNGWSRWDWRQNTPQATYLAFLVMGDYDVSTDTAEDGTPIVTAYSNALGENAGAARSAVERTNEIVNWETTLFGPYPFSSRGGVVVPDWVLGLALETQGCPVYDGAFWSIGTSQTYVVAHENAHQWFGDSVSVAAWRDIWLNEGFASYAEWLWSEKQGEGTAQELFDYNYALHPADDPFWTVEPGDPGAADLFDGAVYDRGAMALHALRTRIGDADFFALLKAWPTQHRYGNATIEQFIALAEQLSGQDLDQLFQAWLFTPSKPAAATLTAKAAPAQPKSWPTIRAAHRALHGR